MKTMNDFDRIETEKLIKDSYDMRDVYDMSELLSQKRLRNEIGSIDYEELMEMIQLRLKELAYLKNATRQ